MYKKGQDTFEFSLVEKQRGLKIPTDLIGIFGRVLIIDTNKIILLSLSLKTGLTQAMFFFS